MGCFSTEAEVDQAETLTPKAAGQASP